MFKEPGLQNIRTEKSANNKILSHFSEKEQEEIENKRKILSSLAFFIGKDFEIPVELNEPGEGWHWDFKNNIIRIDPKDLLEKPMDYLRFVISHEGGHRRISRTDFIPLETWQQPGFSFLMNSIEDPRDNNFVAESYHQFREQMEAAYKEDLDIEEKHKKKAKEELGYTPRFMQAGFEYIKQWFREAQGENFEISDELPAEVKEAVEKTLKSARESWLTYPSKEMADGLEAEEFDGKSIAGEDLITEYARVSYEINLEEIWPEFKKLVEKDQEDQKMQEFMKDMESDKQEKGISAPGQNISQDLKDKLTPEEQQELEEAIEEAIEDAKNKDAEGQEEQEEGGGEQTGESSSAKASADKEGEDGANSGNGTPIDLDSLSEELKQKIKDYINGLPTEKQKELEEKAQKTINDFAKEISKDLEGKLLENPEEKAESREGEDEDKKEKADDEKKGMDDKEKTDFKNKEKEEFRKNLNNIFSKPKEDSYSSALKKMAPMIDSLSGDLRDVFIKRKQKQYEAEYRSGKRWNVKKRVKEKIAGIPLFKSEAREQRNIESEEKDYAITLMVDLSGSMQGGNKIQEAFKSVVLLAETLNDIEIKFEIVGFQDRLLEFKKFDDYFSDEVRQKLNQILLEANNNNPGGNNNCGDNNDGECLLGASDHLDRQMAKNKFLIVLSDGAPAMDSGEKSPGQLDKELKEAVKYIKENTEQKLIGVGLLSGAVKKYYENNIPDVSAAELAKVLGGIIREIIEDY